MGKRCGSVIENRERFAEACVLNEPCELPAADNDSERNVEAFGFRSEAEQLCQCRGVGIGHLGEVDKDTGFRPVDDKGPRDFIAATDIEFAAEPNDRER